MLPKSISNLIEEFSRLPGIGPKSASRIVFYLLSQQKEDLERLSTSVAGLKENLKICSDCYNYGETDPCEICLDEQRNKTMVCVVEEPLDVIALDRAGFDGLFHVLGGVISPINGIGPDDIRIKELVDRVRKDSDKIKEIILATNPSLEGEATAVYIQDRLRDLDVKVTRLARGLPVGGDLEYADELTLSRSLDGRKEF
jgi:recombination protein RecR